MKPALVSTLLLALSASLPCGAIAQEISGISRPAQAAAPKVQLALLLDTSNSMDGLINQARTQLWQIVNEFIAARRTGLAPEVEVALYEYGNNTLSAESQWIRCVCPLTRDLDEVSARLFSLTTNGGEEYCGAVIRQAIERTAWNSAPGTYKAIFIAGNEPFTQGPVNSSESCEMAGQRNLIVNTIHCGDEGTGIRGGWKSGALLAGGNFLTIDQNEAVVHIDAPQDAEIVRLSEELNHTYLAWGTSGKAMAQRQQAQDVNAANATVAAAVSRAGTKACASLYCNDSWDLVDAVRNQSVDLTTLEKSLLPEALRTLSTEQLRAEVQKQQAARTALQQKIQALNAERLLWIAARTKAATPDKTLQTAVVRTLHAQAGKLGYTWEGASDPVGQGAE